MRFNKLLLALLLCASTCVYAEEKTITPSPGVAALADVGTTIFALGHGAHEMNPIGLAGSTVLKGAYFLYRDEFTEADRKFLDRAGSSLWSGAAVNNIIVGLGGTFALPVGIVAGIGIYLYND